MRPDSARERGQGGSRAPALAAASHLEVGEVLLHEAVDLAHGQAASLAVLQGHGDQTAAGEGGRARHGGVLGPRPKAPSSRKPALLDPRGPAPTLTALTVGTSSWPYVFPAPCPLHLDPELSHRGCRCEKPCLSLPRNNACGPFDVS